MGTEIHNQTTWDRHLLLYLLFFSRRQEAHMKDIDKKQKECQDAAIKIQQQLQQAKVKMAIKSWFWILLHFVFGHFNVGINQAFWQYSFQV